MTTLPVNINYGRIEARFLTYAADGPDEDTRPDWSISGTVLFTPSAPVLKNRGAATTIINSAITGIFDDEGNLCTRNGDLLVPGVYLIATDDADLDPWDWSYTVTYSLMRDGIPITSPARHILKVPTNTTQNLINFF